MEIYVIRHGRTEANAAGVLLGRANPSLDSEGVVQAERIAACLPPIDRVVSSPLARCLETASLIGPSPEVDERIIEVDYGVFDLVPIGSVPRAVWKKWTTDINFVPDSGESMAMMGERVNSFFDDLVANAKVERVAVVTHVSPIKASLAWSLGASLEIMFRAQVSQASISVIRAEPPRTSLVGFNSTDHLD